jgi:hypothetical protein
LVQDIELRSFGESKAVGREDFECVLRIGQVETSGCKRSPIGSFVLTFDFKERRFAFGLLFGVIAGIRLSSWWLAFKKIGMPQCALALRRASQRVPDPFSIDHAAVDCPRLT